MSTLSCLQLERILTSLCHVDQANMCSERAVEEVDADKEPKRLRRLDAWPASQFVAP